MTVRIVTQLEILRVQMVSLMSRDILVEIGRFLYYFSYIGTDISLEDISLQRETLSIERKKIALGNRKDDDEYVRKECGDDNATANMVTYDVKSCLADFKARVKVK